MVFSHHSHSGQFCRHAKGKLEDMVDAAISKGFTTFALTEHMPRNDLLHLYPEESDLTPNDLFKTFSNFIVEANKLKILHDKKRDVQLLIGMETEWIHSTSFENCQWLNHVLQKHGRQIDFLVGSVHHVFGIPIDFDQFTFSKALHRCKTLTSPPSLDEKETLFCEYFDAQFNLISNFKPMVIGHFDLCRLYNPHVQFDTFPTTKVWDKVDRNISFAIQYGALFEINSAALKKGWPTPYPGPEVLRLICEKGGRLTLSDDSHSPEGVGLHYDKTLKYLKDQGVQELWYLSSEENQALDSSENSKTSTGNFQLSGKVQVRKVAGEWWEDDLFKSFTNVFQE